MTVSLNKGKKYESNFRHNERKTQLQDESPKVVESFYETENHQHIHCGFTRLNVDKPHEDFAEVYDRLFGKAIEEYNNKQKRKDRMIGKGKAINGELKKNNILELKLMLNYLSGNADDRKKIVENLGGQQIFESTFLEKYKGKTEKDLKKDLSFWENQETYGEAYYRQIKKDGKTKTHTEFIAQLGNAEDFNEIKNGKIIKSYDREDPNGKWQKAKRALKMYMDGFQERNPNLILVGYSIHMDENTPHVHFDIVPVAEQSKIKGRGKTRKNGLSKKLSFDGALQSQGFSGKPKQLFTEWQHQETEVLADLMQKELGEKRKAGKTNHLENVHEYKQLKALEADKLENLAKIDQQVDQKQNIVKDLENQKQDITQQLTEGVEIVKKKVQDWASKKTQKLDDREKALDDREKADSSKELILSDREEKVTAKENTLKQSQNALESEKKAFDKKVKESGDLDQQIAKKQKKLDEIDNKMDESLNNYSFNLDKKKKEILAKKQKELDKEKAKQLAEFKQKVDRDKQAYIDDVNRQYRKSVEQREKAVEQKEKRFKDKVKNLVDGFRLVYISHGLKTMYGTDREVKYRAQQYLQLTRDQQKVVEKQVFSGPAGLYSKLSAFKDAVDYVFHGAPDAAELSPLQSLDDLAGEAEAEAGRYDNLQNSRGRSGSPSPSRSVGPEL